ncbi:MAG: ion transporter [Deltaproteobacteria bacterium]|nr:MAG: ion transporter [Deltaproteobacteria bacterium]
MTESWKRRVDRLLNPGDDDNKWMDTFIIVLIAANVLAVMMETEPEYHEAYQQAFWAFDVFSSLFFTVEYVARLWICTLDEDYRHPVFGRVRYAFTVMAFVDLIAILPFYLPFLITMDLRILRAIRLLRLVRILKMGRYAHAVRTLTNVLVRKKEELAMTWLVLVLLLVMSSSGIYFVEHVEQPEAFRSIPSSMWWSVVTLTSVGYGDVYPVTSMGRFVGAIVSMVGVGFVALPTGILAAGFNEEIREQKRGKDAETFGYCPHCGEKLIPGEELD